MDLVAEATELPGEEKARLVWRNIRLSLAEKQELHRVFGQGRIKVSGMTSACAQLQKTSWTEMDRSASQPFAIVSLAPVFHLS